ncbi:nickel pincer cofactor biosynthesis protein LarC [Ligilactobacillus acidipiscis]|uniref:nickel pincer cofactor biosynthesis protein LarC n=1 Tax=Ligilactobacillus acidipiscis TaxID=89059 RepID=UPI0023F881A0|nr:nickel pincer cofactor biosynthesis protein LarC [Ligilactobacillus acidipiscis]WEV57521.1 nickel pincer cofactor biosynthesis protein LarC [Ligilactobacillus acidipiscis]
MTRTLFLDCGYGISGDMFLSALCDLGVDIDDVHEELKKVIEPKFDLKIEKMNQHGITANHLKLKFYDETLNNIDSGEHKHTHTHYASIKENIANSTLDAHVKELSLKMFATVAQAESKIHGIPVQDIAFHEVGAVDSLVDIIGGCVAIDNLRVDQIISTPVATGFGKVKVAHGLYPVPAPATLEILQGVPLQDFEIESELTTPTGAAIVKTFTTSFSNSMKGNVLQSGYGAGNKKFDHPNVLRAVLLDTEKKSDNTVNEVCELTCELDDMTGESLGQLLKSVMNDGALDMYYTPIIMKKNRPAYQITLLCKVGDEDYFKQKLLLETTTFGVRSTVKERAILKRDFSEINLPEGVLMVKQGYYKGDLIKVTPEFESVRKLALANKVSYNNMYLRSLGAIQEQFKL